MAEITAALVKQLRGSTGAGMMDAKKALVESDGDMDAAVDWLRKKGLSKAAKKSGRTAADGLVAAAISADGKTGAAVELNAETDFVARNGSFQSALRGITRTALETDGSLEALTASPAPEGDGTVADLVTRLVATIGENMTLRRVARLEVEAGAVASYIHNGEADGMGKVAVLVGLEGDPGQFGDAGRKVAMHVAATAPAAARVDELDPGLVERERAVLTDESRASGKPEGVIEKMIEGRMKKFYKDVVLVEQPFVMDPDMSVGAYLETVGARLVGFERFALGEGIERQDDDFAAEVASLSGQG